jgi:hypothetical protein
MAPMRAGGFGLAGVMAWQFRSSRAIQADAR